MSDQNKLEVFVKIFGFEPQKGYLIEVEKSIVKTIIHNILSEIKRLDEEIYTLRQKYQSGEITNLEQAKKDHGTIGSLSSALRDAHNNYNYAVDVARAMGYEDVCREVGSRP